MTEAAPRIAVVGAGIVGAAIAFRLAQGGARVTLLDGGKPGAGVTARAFAWINASHGVAEPNAALRQHAIAAWHALEADLGRTIAVDWHGALTWHGDPAETARMVRDHAARGYDIRMVDRAEIASLEPNLTEPPAQAAFAPGEGAVDPLAATRALVRAAEKAGADVRAGTAVAGIETTNGRVSGIRTAEATIDADFAVLAAGANTRALCARLDIALPVEKSRAILLRFRAAKPLVGRIVASPAMEVRQGGDDLLLAAEDYIDDTPANGPVAIAQRALDSIRRQLRGGERVRFERAEVGVRPMPADGLPIVGFLAPVGGLYVAVMHGGVTLAPAVARLVAAELLDGTDEDLLKSSRPARFAAESQSR